MPPPPGAEEEDGVVEWMLLRAAGRDLAADLGRSASGRMLPSASMKTMIDGFVDEMRRREPVSGKRQVAECRKAGQADHLLSIC